MAHARTHWRLLVAIAAPACIGLLISQPARSSESSRPLQTRDLLQQVRDATRAYQDVAAAKAAGYAPANECVDDPKYGAMGIHYANARLVADNSLDSRRPEILVYQPGRNGKLHLGAVEYFRPDADQNLATDFDRPTLFGLPFDGPMLGHTPGMPIHYDLHVWLFRSNAAGTFAAFNPGVHCPKG